MQPLEVVSFYSKPEAKIIFKNMQLISVS